MNDIANISDLTLFTQAAESYAKDRPVLLDLKGQLEERLGSIKQSLAGMEAANSPQLDPEEYEELKGRIRRAEDARSYTVRKLLVVDRLLGRMNREGGWLLWTEGWRHGWVATKVPVSEWILAELELHGEDAREVCFSVPLTQDQWSRLPDTVMKYPHEEA